MQNQDELKLEALDKMTLNLSYDEFRWILKELRIPITEFLKRLKMSHSTLQNFKVKGQLMPFFIIDELIVLTEGTFRLQLLRLKYTQIH